MKRHLNRALIFLGLLCCVQPASSQGINSIISNQIQAQISRQISAGISKNLNENLLIPQLTVKNQSGQVKDFTLSHDERYFSLLHQDGSVRVWDAKSGVQRPVINPEGRIFNKVATSSAANSVLIGATNGKVYVYDILTAKPVSELDADSLQGVAALAVSKSDDKLAVAYADGKIQVWDLLKSQKTAALTTNHADITDLAFTGNDKALLVVGKDGGVESWNIEKSRKTAELGKETGKSLGLWQSPASDLVFVDGDGNLQWLEQPGNRLRLNKKIPADGPVISATLSFSGKLLSAVDNTRKIRLFNLDDLSAVKEIPTTANVNHLRFMNQGKHLLGTDENGVIRVWDVAQAKELMQLISTNTGWTVVDNAGRFDSSEGGLSNISWQAGDKDIPIDNTSANYYEPYLLATQLNSDAFINQSPQKIQEGINLPPEVTLTAPASGEAGDEVQVSFEMVDAGGGIGDHRIYHNGKLIDPSLMADSVDTEVNDITHRKVVYKVALLPGNNKFKVVALNKMGIESPTQVQVVQASGAEKQPDLYVVVIGINKYDDPNLDLSYSVQDAKSIVSTLGNKNTSAFKNIYPTDILDTAATKESIFAKFAKIAENSKPNDALIVYFAGHGIAVKGEWYFLPHEVTFHPDEDYYTKAGISAKQIQNMIAKIPAEKILVMFDSCYSGSGLKVFEDLKKTQRHFGRSLSKTDGVVVLAATRKDQEALELTELGHGLFTYVVNKGMAGAADLKPKDTNVSAHEVVNYVTDTIPTYTHKWANASQEPTSFTIGDDFTLLGL